MTAGMLPGPYRVPAYRVTGHVQLTNKTPAATYRAPGRYEGTFVRERLMDAIASRLGLDAVEVRRRNLIAKAEMPYERPLDAIGDEIVYDSGDYAGLLDRALAAVGWEALQVALRQRRAAGEAVGASLAIFVEKSGLGPTDRVTISVDNDGIVELVTGGASVGQGFETVMAQIAADPLGVDYRRVRVVHGHTDRIDRGVGARASRATVMTGSATHLAAATLRAKALEAAAELMQMPAAALDLVGGVVICKDRPGGASMTLGEIARGSPSGLGAEGQYRTEHMNYSYGVHIAVVRVDRETGRVAVEGYLAAYDIGRAVNPMLIEGQMAGGFAQGLGGALFEEFVYDQRGEPLCGTFADYLVPTAGEVPALEVLVTKDAPSPLNPLGLKGAGEAWVNGVGAAIAAAIDDAIGIPGAVTQLPVTPQRLRDIVRTVSERHGSSPSSGSPSRRDQASLRQRTAAREKTLCCRWPDAWPCSGPRPHSRYSPAPMRSRRKAARSSISGSANRISRPPSISSRPDARRSPTVITATRRLTVSRSCALPSPPISTAVTESRFRRTSSWSCLAAKLQCFSRS
jgi:carbon-monoxide dehydrogenase large subunit